MQLLRLVERFCDPTLLFSGVDNRQLDREYLLVITKAGETRGSRTALF